MLNCAYSMPSCERQSCLGSSFPLWAAIAKSIAHRESFGTVSSPLYAGLLPSTGCQKSSRDGAERQQQPILRSHGRYLATECRPIVETYMRDGQSRLCTGEGEGEGLRKDGYAKYRSRAGAYSPKLMESTQCQRVSGWAQGGWERGCSALFRVSEFDMHGIK